MCEEPLLTIDRQVALNIVHPEGRVRQATLRSELMRSLTSDFAAREDNLSQDVLRLGNGLERRAL